MKEERIISLKATKTKSGKFYYYQRFGDDSFWERIPKWNFEIDVKDYKNEALEIKHDENGDVVFIRFKFSSQKTEEKLGLKYSIQDLTQDRGPVHLNLITEPRVPENKKGCFSIFLFILFLLILIVLKTQRQGMALSLQMGCF